jgi:NAD(P)-dependent dehydrogenase (short-subunit alcohol dehydrogenase family)
MMDRDSLTGRIAEVNGGGSGPGAAMARSLAEVGMAVAALDIDEVPLWHARRAGMANRR